MINCHFIASGIITNASLASAHGEVMTMLRIPTYNSYSIVVKGVTTLVLLYSYFYFFPSYVRNVVQCWLFIMHVWDAHVLLLS